MSENEIKALQDELKTLRETASAETAKRKAAQADLLMHDLHKIHPIDESERASLRETANGAVDDDGVLRLLKSERLNKALKAEVETIKLTAEEAGKKLLEELEEAKAALKNAPPVAAESRPGDVRNGNGPVGLVLSQDKRASDSNAHPNDEARKNTEADDLKSDDLAKKMDEEKKAADARKDDKKPEDKNVEDKVLREQASDFGSKAPHFAPVYGRNGAIDASILGLL